MADVPRAAEFYEDVVGLEPFSRTGDEWAWFLAGEPGTEQRIAVHKGSLLFEEHSPHPEGHRFGNIHFALDVPRDRLDAAVAHVRSKGVEVYGPVFSLSPGKARPGQQVVAPEHAAALWQLSTGHPTPPPASHSPSFQVTFQQGVAATPLSVYEALA